MNPMRICSFRVLIKPDPIQKEHVSKDGQIRIEIARTQRDERRERAAQTTGTILQVGPTAWKAYDDGEPWAKEGDRVLYTRYGGRYIENPDDPDNDLIIVDDENVLAILGENNG